MTVSFKEGSEGLSLREGLVLAPLWAAFAGALFFNGIHIWLLGLAGVLLVVFAVLAVGPGIRESWRVPRSPAAAALVVFWAFLGISLAWSTVVFTSSLYYWWLSALPLTFFALILAPSPEAWTRAALTGLGLGVLVLAGWALVQFFGFPEEYGFRAQGPLLNPNNLAGLLNLALVPLIAGYLGVQRERATVLLFGGSVLVFAGVTATQSRGALIGLAIGLAVLLVFGRHTPGARALRLASLGGACLAVFVFMNWWADDVLAQRLETLGSVGAQASFQTRLAIWEGTWSIVANHPWLGTGLGTFFLYYPRYRLAADDSSGGYYAHMDPLQLWSEIGVAGPLLFYLFLTAILVQTVRAVRTVPETSRLRLEVLGPFGGLLAVAVHTHITFHFYILPILIAAGAVLAGWQLACERATGDTRKSISLPAGAHPRVWRAILAGIVALVLLDLGSATAANRFIHWGREAVSQGEVGSALDYFHYARALAPASDTAYALGAEIRREALRRAEGEFTDKEKAALYREAHDLLDRAQQWSPPRAKLDHVRGQLYQVAPDDTERDREALAKTALQRALTKDPLFLDARLDLVSLYRERGKDRKALETLEAGTLWPYPGLKAFELYLRLAGLRRELGQEEEARQATREAIKRIPEGNSKLARQLAGRYGIEAQVHPALGTKKE